MRQKDVVVEEYLIKSIKQIFYYAKENESQFIKSVLSKSKSEVASNLHRNKNELQQVLERIEKLDGIIQHLYEDNLDGKISDERFMRLTLN